MVTGLPDGIMVIFQDSKKNYWFGSKENGVYYYDGNSFKQFTQEDGLHSNRIRGIQEDPSGNIYFDTGEGISKFDGKQIEQLVLSEDPNPEWKLGPNDVWFEGYWGKKGPYRYDGKQLYHMQLPKHEFEEEFYVNTPNASYDPYEIYKIYKDSKNYIWMGTGTFGACRFDGGSLTWVSEREMTEIDPGPAPGVRSILEDEEGNFWFSSNVNHKYQVPEFKAAVSTEKPKYQKLKGIDTSGEQGMNPYFMAITQDTKGDFWMVTYDSGAWRYDGKRLVHYPVKYENKEVLIFTIYKDRQDQLWLGTHNAGAMKFNGKTFERFKP